MAEALWSVDVSKFDELSEAMENYGDGAGKVISEYLDTVGYNRIAAHIPGLIHASGRRWKRKPTSAGKAPYTSVFEGRTYGMTLTITSKSRYGYLYFPDDGSNTRRHDGGQHFMLRGAQEMTAGIISDLVGRLVQNFKEA